MLKWFNYYQLDEDQIEEVKPVCFYYHN